MINILDCSKLIESLKKMPDVRDPNVKDIAVVNRKVRLGFIVCKFLVQKSWNNEHAIELLYKLVENVT